MNEKQLSLKPAELVNELSFAEASALAEACTARMQFLREAGVYDLAEKFEAMASVEVGMSAKSVLALLRKAKRKSGRKPAAHPTLSVVEK